MTPQLALDLIQPLAPSLDNFVPGRNAEVLAALRAVGTPTGPSIVYLWGDVGSGRTHLLLACGSVPDTRVPTFEEGHRVYTVDDVDQLDGNEQHRLFNLANEIRATPGTSLVAAGNGPPSTLRLREDVRTRLAWGLVYHLQPLSDDDKSEALMRHASSRGIELSADVLNYLLTHLPRNMRTLIAILDALDAHALAARRAITVPFVREWINTSAT